jgi:hypothetical protein
MSSYLPEGRATMTSSPVFQKGYEMYDPSSIGSQITGLSLAPMKNTLGLAGSWPGSTSMYLPSKEEFIEKGGKDIRQGELDWAETFGHETSHLGWQYEPKKIGSVLGKDINIPGEFGALSVSGKGGEEKWNYLHDLMYGSGAVMKEHDKRHKEYIDAVDKYKKGEISLDEANKFKDKYYQMPNWESSSLGHLKGITDPGETDVTGKLINPGDWSYTPQAFHDVGTSGLISEHKKALGVGFNPFEDTRAAGQWYKQQKNKKMSQAKKQAALQQRIRQHEAAQQVQQNIQTYGNRDRPNTGMNVPGGGKGQSPTGGDVAGTPFVRGGIVDLYRHGGF